MRVSTTLLLAVVSVAGGTGCAKTVAAPGCPAHGGHPWYEVRTRHFTIRTDVARDDVKKTAESFERGYTELAAAGFPRGLGGAASLDLVVLHDQRELSEHWPDRGGFSVERLGADIEHAPTLVFPGSGYPPQVRAVFLHELTHRFVAYRYGPVPTWLNEGLAEYYSTLRFENGKAVLGDVVPGAYVPAGVAPSVRELLAAKQSTFYAEDVSVPYRRDEVRALYYSASFAFVHFLSNGPDEKDDLRGRFRRMRGLLSDGKGYGPAWEATFGDVPLENLEEGFRAYVTSYGWDRFVYDAPKLEIDGTATIRALDDLEIDLLWARLLAGEKGADERAKLALAAARVHAPRSAEVDYVEGSLALARDPAGARASFEEALLARPEDPRILFGLVLALVAEGRGRQMPPANEARVGALVGTLAKVARTADQLGLVAEWECMHGDGSAALAAAERAITIDPGYFGSHLVRARVYFESKRFAEATAEQERAIALLPDSASAHRHLRDLARYRAARDAR